MDTGLLYRAVALNLWRWGGDLASEFEAMRACDVAAVDPDDPEMRSEPVSKHRLARCRPIRRFAPRCSTGSGSFAGKPGGAVLDGRDIGTVVAPEADAKLYVTASPEVRAQRRVRELLERGMPAHYEDVLTDIRARDEREWAARRRRCARPTTRPARYHRADCRRSDRRSDPAGRAAPREASEEIARTVGSRT